MSAAVSDILAPDHRGVRVNGFRCLQQAHGTGFTFIRREMARHLQEMGRRYYAGDVTAVDEFLQLYCIAESERAAVVAEWARKEAQP